MNTIHPEAGHAAADSILRRAVPYHSKAAYAEDQNSGTLDLNNEESFGLRHPCSQRWTISITFTRMSGRSDVMWVRSTNWRCEHEPNGAMKIEAARDLYRRLVATGMVAF